MIGTLFLLVALCQVPALASDLEEIQGRRASQAVTTQASLLDLPPSDGPVKVRATFHLLDITEIDEEAETFEFSGVVELQWIDKRQAFDPAVAGVDVKVYQGDYQFNELSPSWYPQVVLANVSGLYEESAVLLRVRPDGRSTLLQTVNAIAKSQLDLRRTPFDSQRLEAVFEVFGFDASEVMLEAIPIPEQNLGSQIKISQWALAGLEVSTRSMDSPYPGGQGVTSAMVLTVNVQRQSWFMVRLIVMPLGLIVVLSWSVFWMDRSSVGDRINVSFVGILTAAAYQIVVSDIMPRVSYMTLLDVFLSISFWIMCASVVINLIVGAADKKGIFQRGDRIDRRCRLAFPLVYASLLLVATAIAFL